MLDHILVLLIRLGNGGTRSVPADDTCQKVSFKQLLGTYFLNLVKLKAMGSGVKSFTENPLAM
jgi:hypothetical protein